MPSVIENLAQIRLLLDEPTPEHPSDRILFQLFSDAIIHHKSRLQNSSAQWDVNSIDVQASYAQEDYLIAAADFGKPFWVYAYDSQDRYHTRVEIPFSMVQNADQFYSGPTQVWQEADNWPSAAVCSFYRKNGSWYFRLTPIPGGSCMYTVWYETQPTAPQSLYDTVGLTPFHHLIRVETAMAALPYVAWGHLKFNAEKDSHLNRWKLKIDMLKDTFKGQWTQWDYQFSTYLSEIMMSGMEPRQPWGFGFDMDDGFAGGVGSFGPNSL